jgi:hypothetical protein
MYTPEATLYLPSKAVVSHSMVPPSEGCFYPNYPYYQYLYICFVINPDTFTVPQRGRTTRIDKYTIKSH